MQALFVIRIGSRSLHVTELHVTLITAVGLGLLAVAAL
jgi:hypothetical protein